MLDEMGNREMPSHDTRVQRCLRHFDKRYIKIVEDEAAKVPTYSLAGYYIFGERTMFREVKGRIERLERHRRCMHAHISANKCFRRWLKKTRDARAKAKAAPSACFGCFF